MKGVTRLTRRTFLASAAAAAAAPPLAGSASASEQPFGFDDVRRIAQARASEAYEPRTQELEGLFADLSYDDYRAIRVPPEARLWRGSGLDFEVEFLPPGNFFRDFVRIHVVENGVAVERPLDFARLRFDPPHFDLPEGRLDQPAPRGMSWSGFRLRFPINDPEVMDEVAVFQGASYFRAIGRGQLFGLSARGLAIRTGAPEGEEFPVFTDFWLHRPERGAGELLVHAVLDSPSVAGAYAFLIRPGAETTMDIEAELYPRRRVEALGVAPLTSMFYFSPASRRGVEDFRDAVHDSNGLQMLTGAGERVWRPLINPATLQISTFVDQDPKGFGLAQRPREFDHYQDAEAHYERRPSAWVAPKEGWGKGGVQLVEIPTETEFNDNVVAFWRPAAPLEADEKRRYAYRLYWGERPPGGTPLATVAGTRRGPAITHDDAHLVVVDFTGASRPVDALEPRLEAPGAEVTSLVLRPLPGPDRIRVAITFRATGDAPVEFRLRLMDKAEGVPVSETWLLRWMEE